jgi:hypothetical protein
MFGMIIIPKPAHVAWEGCRAGEFSRGVGIRTGERAAVLVDFGLVGWMASHAENAGLGRDKEKGRGD